MTTIPHSLAAAVAVSFCLAILPAVPVIAGEDAVPASDTVSLGVAYADLGDFSGDWGLRIRWNHGHWLIAGGWTNVNDVVPAQGGAMKVDGDLWQLDANWVWWNLNPAPDEKPGRPDIYYGLGVGLANIDADWTLSGITKDAKKVSFAGNVAVGAQWRRAFLDVRYVFGTSYWDWDSDGVQVSVGAVWPIGK